MIDTVLLPLSGGVLIGVAASAFLLLSGRIAGISGIVGGAFASPRGWRFSFIAGLIVGGALWWLFSPSAFPEPHPQTTRTVLTLAAAGLLVGFGTRLGSGCTSGHGVCGIGRLSTRSIVATLTFIATGALVVVLVRSVS